LWRLGKRWGVIVVDDPSQAVWSRSADVAFVDDGDRIVVLRLTGPTKGRPQLLIGTAALIWRHLQSPRTTQALCSSLQPGVAEPPHIVARDVNAFLVAAADELLVKRTADH
jgi:hypothetical protein